MPELVLSTATEILWYPAETIKCHEGMGGTAAELVFKSPAYWVLNMVTETVTG